MVWYTTFDAVFFITVTTICAGSFGLVIKYCLKSKCEDVNCMFGLLKFHRQVQLEVQEEIREMELHRRASQTPQTPYNVPPHTPTRNRNVSITDLTLEIP